ncbi:hypothetical protein E2C01_037435 [Portunus trituberculatus]|uniref:Uncharacterized protein n=1 Tax=Portunus trituberculatus TaxID=210409 RepID=A0A5B7FFA8_PORTR|nr:hypothetical protein [Portunus trituberculatus]
MVEEEEEEEEGKGRQQHDRNTAQGTPHVSSLIQELGSGRASTQTPRNRSLRGIFSTHVTLNTVHDYYYPSAVVFTSITPLPRLLAPSLRR